MSGIGDALLKCHMLLQFLQVHSPHGAGAGGERNYWRWTGSINGRIGHHQSGPMNAAMPCRVHNLQWVRRRRGSNQGFWRWTSPEQPDPDQQYGGSRNTSQGNTFSMCIRDVRLLGCSKGMGEKLGGGRYLGGCAEGFWAAQGGL